MRKDDIIAGLRAQGNQSEAVRAAIALLSDGRPLLTHEVRMPNGLRRRYPSKDAADRCVAKQGGSVHAI